MRLRALALLAATGCGEPPDERGASAPTPAAAPEPWVAVFEDDTARSGIAFAHATGGRGEKLLPETMGSGACLFDFDGDGALDLFLVNSGAWPAATPGADAPRCALWRGRGDGTFEDVSRASGADLALYGMGAAAADFDGDGDEDLYVTALGPDVLLVNEGGRFRDGTRAAELEHDAWSTAALWLDAEADGDLDLFVGGYCRWSPELEIFTTLNGVDKAFTTPDRYDGLPCRLYLNRGDGTFALEELPVEGKALGAATWDLDGDGLPEIAVANDTRPNFLLWNLGAGRLDERGARLGLAYDENGRARAGMGIDVADLLGDAVPEVAIGNFAGEPLSLWSWTPPSFRTSAARAGLARATYDPLTFGLAFLDADLDGLLDLVIVNGHIEPDVARFRPGERHAQAAQLFRGRADGTFEDVSDRAGEDFARPRVGRGLAHGDLDGDGDLDLVVTQNGGPAVVLRNRCREDSDRRALRVDLRGPPGNPRALGARLELEADGRRQVRTVRTGGSYLSQSEVTATFGLGRSPRADALEVRWPDGTVQRVEAPEAGRTLVSSPP